MITLQECIEMCDLTEAEIEAIAEHEHIPMAAATALADYLLHKEKGATAIRQMIKDDIRAAIRAGNAAHARQLIGALHHFMQEHPEAKA